MNNFHTKGVILKRINYGEADRIITTFTNDFGKINFIAKGSRKIRSKTAGAIELFYISDLVLSKGKNLYILNSSSIIKPFLPQQDLTSIKLGGYIAEVIIKTIPDDSPNDKIYSLLEEVFGSFNQDINLSLLGAYFSIQYIQLSGVSPNLEVCTKCGIKPSTEIYFSNAANGLLDKSCAQFFHDSKKIEINTIKSWRYMTSNNLPQANKLNIPTNDIEELNQYSFDYLQKTAQLTFRSKGL
ncbi:MAG: DNA repair protein RecO [bacterium]